MGTKVKAETNNNWSFTNLVRNGGLLELLKYAGAVGVIVSLAYFAQIVFAGTTKIDSDIIRLWTEQTKVLQDIRTILVVSSEDQKRIYQALDSLRIAINHLSSVDRSTNAK